MTVFWLPNALDELADVYVRLPLDDQWYTDWLQVLFEVMPGGEVEVIRVRDNRRESGG